MSMGYKHSALKPESKRQGFGDRWRSVGLHRVLAALRRRICFLTYAAAPQGHIPSCPWREDVCIVCESKAVLDLRRRIFRRSREMRDGINFSSYFMRHDDKTHLRCRLRKPGQN